MPRRYTKIIWRSILAAVFIWAAVAKLYVGYDIQFPATIYQHFVHHHPVLHYAFIATEFSLGLWLLSGFFTRASAFVSVVLLCLFTVILAVELRKADPRRCGCMELILPDGQLNSTFIRRSLLMGIFRNLLLISASTWLAFSKPASAHSLPPSSDSA